MKYKCENNHIFEKTGTRTLTEADNGVLELPVCPICTTIIFEEYKQEITNVLSVELAQVDQYLAKGYVIHTLYAKTATLVKKKD